MPETTAAIFILIGVFFVLLVCRVPVAIAMGVASIATYAYLGLPLSLVVQYTVGGANVFTFLAVPFFILGGELINQGGIGEKLVDFANACVGWIPGGAALVNVMSSMFFGGISGSAPADIASIGPFEIKIMESQGFDRDFSTGLTMASAVQGMLIPPSHNLVIYACAAGSVSIAALFMAGLPAGIFLGIVLMVYSVYYAIRKKIRAAGRFNLKEVIKTGISAFFGMMTIVIIFAGVVGGIMTATESAAIAALWAFLCAWLIYRGIKLKDYYKIATSAVKMLSMILILMAVANAFGWVVAYLRIPNLVANAILSITSNRYLILLIIIAITLALGCIMSISSLILILTPILVPILTALNVSLVHFGIVFILCMGIGLLTPPVGAALYVGAAVSGLSIGRTAKALTPFYICLTAALLLLTYIPTLSMWLPNLLGLT